MTLQQSPVLDEAIDDRSAVRWMSPAAGLWVASRPGAAADLEYAGMIERSDGMYHARSARGRALGSFEDLDSAQAVVAAGADDSRGAPRGVRATLCAVLGGSALGAFALALALVR